MKFDWEKIKYVGTPNEFDLTNRAKVFGGWLVRTIYHDSNKNVRTDSLVFIPDANHDWKID